MTDFNDLLDKSMDDIKPPPVFPIGHYKFQIQGHEFGKSSKKKTPFVQINFKYLEASEDVNAEALAEIISEHEMDLKQKRAKYLFYLTDDAMFMLKDFLNLLGYENMSTRKALAEITGEVVQGHVTQDTSDDGKRTFNNIDAFVKA